MNKAVCVIDMPNSCFGCIFYSENCDKDGFCYVMDDQQNKCKPRIIDASDNNGIIPDWCPLKELPEEIHNDEYLDEYCDGYDDGWNSLRKKILGI